MSPIADFVRRSYLLASKNLLFLPNDNETLFIHLLSRRTHISRSKNKVNLLGGASLQKDDGTLKIVVQSVLGPLLPKEFLDSDMSLNSSMAVSAAWTKT